MGDQAARRAAVLLPTLVGHIQRPFYTLIVADCTLQLKGHARPNNSGCGFGFGLSSSHETRLQQQGFKAEAEWAHCIGQHANDSEGNAPGAALGALPHRQHHARRQQQQSRELRAGGGALLDKHSQYRRRHWDARSAGRV